MGAQSTDQGIIEVKFDSYHFQIRVISSSEVGLEVIDTKTFQKFSLNSHSFKTQVNSSTLIAALQKKEDQYLKLSVSHQQSSEKEIVLKITLRVSFDFIPHFEECLIVPLDKNVNEKDMLQTQMKLINSEIRDLQTQLDHHTNKISTKVVATCKSGTYNGQSHNICQIDLPKGKYEINLSFYSQSNQTWIYIKLMNNQTGIDILKLQEQGFYYQLANQSHYQPHIIRSIVDITSDTATLTLDTNYCNSYPWNMKNLVLSATSI